MRRPVQLAAPRPVASLVASLVVSLVALTACGTTTQGGSATPDAGDTRSPASASAAPPADGRNEATDGAVPEALRFRARTLDGEPFEGAALAGRPVVLWFWAPWCPTCRAQAPGVSKLADQFGDDLSFVGVGGLDDAAAMDDFAGAVDGAVTLLADEEGAVWRRFGVAEQSTYVVLDARGDTVASGYLDDDELASVVADLAG